ncbi:hypothetical protein H5410_030598 [Solanum commersonii]|uniref:Uncharacterized protein n=1 Tax=Solanum commersonii TaxID=4109 RepID=A0A9J5YJ59_SOLCO|nr:hypothetical protein H5410_030598 [Solanum commersonii]
MGFKNISSNIYTGDSLKEQSRGDSNKKRVECNHNKHNHQPESADNALVMILSKMGPSATGRNQQPKQSLQRMNATNREQWQDVDQAKDKVRMIAR